MFSANCKSEFSRCNIGSTRTCNIGSTVNKYCIYFHIQSRIDVNIFLLLQDPHVSLETLVCYVRSSNKVRNRVQCKQVWNFQFVELNSRILCSGGGGQLIRICCLTLGDLRNVPPHSNQLQLNLLVQEPSVDFCFSFNSTKIVLLLAMIALHKTATSNLKFTTSAFHSGHVSKDEILF